MRPGRDGGLRQGRDREDKYNWSGRRRSHRRTWLVTQIQHKSNSTRGRFQAVSFTLAAELECPCSYSPSAMADARVSIGHQIVDKWQRRVWRVCWQGSSHGRSPNLLCAGNFGGWPSPPLPQRYSAKRASPTWTEAVSHHWQPAQLSSHSMGGQVQRMAPDIRYAIAFTTIDLELELERSQVISFM